MDHTGRLNGHLKPNILFLSGWPIGLTNGKVSFIYEQINTLAKITNANFAEFHFNNSLQHLFLNIFSRTSTKLNYWPDGINSYSFLLPKLSTRITKRSTETVILKSSKILAKALRSRNIKPDLIHAHVLFPAGLFAYTISKELKIPYIVQEHSAPFSMHLNSQEKIDLGKIILKNASAVVAVGESLKLEMEKYCPINAEVIPNHIDTDFFKPTFEPKGNNSFQIVSVGGLEERKCFDKLIHACSILRNENVDFNLKIAGDGTQRSYLTNMIQDLKLDGKVELLGFQTREQIKHLLQSADLYIHTSSLETFGLAPAEAIACGTPVISTSCGGPETYINKDNGIIIQNNDPQTIVNAFFDFYNQRERYNSVILHEGIKNLFGCHLFQNYYQTLYARIINQ